MKMPTACFDRHKCQMRVAYGRHGGSFEGIILKQLSGSPRPRTLTQEKANCKKLDFNENTDCMLLQWQNKI